MYFAAPVRDKNTGLFVEEPGCVVLDPDQALAYARARHFQYQDADGTWRFDETGDLGRITRQQDFIKRAMQRASEAGLRNPGTAFGIVDAATDAVVMDETLNVGTILDLRRRVPHLQPRRPGHRTRSRPFADPSGRRWPTRTIDWDETIPLLLPYWGYDDNGQLDAGGHHRGRRRAPGPRPTSSAMVADGLDEVGFDAEPDQVAGARATRPRSPTATPASTPP